MISVIALHLDVQAWVRGGQCQWRVLRGGVADERAAGVGRGPSERQAPVRSASRPGAASCWVADGVPGACVAPRAVLLCGPRPPPAEPAWSRCTSVQSHARLVTSGGSAWPSSPKRCLFFPVGGRESWAPEEGGSVSPQDRRTVKMAGGALAKAIAKSCDKFETID